MNARSMNAFATAGTTLAVAAGPVAIAAYLGLTAAELRAQLGTGKSLAQIAVAQGKTVSGLEEAVYADVEAHLDHASANGLPAAA
jgi:hypothetical protein